MKMTIYLIKDDLNPLPFDDIDSDNFWPDMLHAGNKAFGLGGWKFKRLNHAELLPYIKDLDSADCLTLNP